MINPQNMYPPEIVLHLMALYFGASVTEHTYSNSLHVFDKIAEVETS